MCIHVIVFYLLVVIAGLFADSRGQNVSLEISRDNQRLDIRCSFPATSSGNISHVSSLVLSRLTGSTEQVLATASLFEEHNDDLLGAKETSAFSPDMKSESFINLRWLTATKDLDGVYSCVLSGFDKDNSHVEISDKETLTLTDVDPALVLTPEDIQVGLTRLMTLNCSVNKLSDIGMSQVFSIDLKATRQGQGVVLSSANVFHGNEIFPGSEHANVTSSLGSKGNYLAMTWPHPDTTLTGRYICEVTGLSSSSQPVNFVRYVDVVVEDPTPQQLVDHIHDWENKYDALGNSCAAAKLMQEEQLQQAQDQLKYMNQSRQVIRKCSDTVHTSGRHPTILTTENGTEINVICEVEEPGKVWTVFQRRYDGSVNFDRNFSSYEEGFGDVDGEFWSGLQNIRTLLGSENNTLRLKFVDSSRRIYTRNYLNFTIGEPPHYKLHIEHGDQENYGLVEYGSGYDFSAKDFGPQKNCVPSSGGAWWFRSCYYNNLNGHNDSSYGFRWHYSSSSSSYYNIDGTTHPPRQATITLMNRK